MSGSWSQHARSVLEQEGYRAGAARLAVIDLIDQEGGCLEAHDLAQRLRKAGKNIGSASVYRALSLLSDLNLLRAAALGDGSTRYELVQPDGSHHHHLVCQRCRKTVNFQDLGLETAIERVSDRSEYEVLGHEVTLRGVCSQCSKKTANRR